MFIACNSLVNVCQQPGIYLPPPLEIVNKYNYLRIKRVDENSAVICFYMRGVGMYVYVV